MRFINHSFRFAHNNNQIHENDVVSGLSYTPAEASRMMSRGAQINLDVMKSAAEFDSDNSLRLPIDRIRGVDINDVFESESHSTEKLNEFKRYVEQHKISQS